MNCPKCGSKALVIDSRNSNPGKRRRRECKECGWRFSTIETVLPESKQSELGRIRKLKHIAAKKKLKKSFVAKKRKGYDSYGKDRAIGSLTDEFKTECKLNEDYACLTDTWSKRPGMKGDYCAECAGSDCPFGGSVEDRRKGKMPRTGYADYVVFRGGR
jgi:hypothetical protein